MKTAEPVPSGQAIEVRLERPPDWIMDGCLSQFRVDVNRTLWTYGDVIYNPGGFEIPEHLLAHEATHMRQQREYEGGKDAWWKEHLTNPQFRMEQEGMAFGVQYAHFCADNRDRNRRAIFLKQLASHLSGPLYQTAISHKEATEYIRSIAEAAM